LIGASHLLAFKPSESTTMQNRTIALNCGHETECSGCQM
jgi:hypothetical protein